MSKIRKWHIRLYAIVLVFAALICYLSSGYLSNEIRNPAVARIYLAFASIITLSSFICFLGLLALDEWARKLGILLNYLFIIHFLLGSYISGVRGPLDFLASIIFICVFLFPAFFIIWLFSHPSVKELFVKKQSESS